MSLEEPVTAVVNASQLLILYWSVDTGAGGQFARNTQRLDWQG
jgi:hypothetical protein